MRDDQKEELVQRVEEKGVKELFVKLGMQEVSQRHGNVYSVCPFHVGADNPNGFAFSNGFGYCFTQCNRKYDLFDIVKRMIGVDFVDAVSYLSAYVGMDIDYSSRKVSSDSEVNRSFLTQVRKMRSKGKAVQWTPIDKSILETFEPSLHRVIREEGFDKGVRDYFDLGYSQSGYLEGRVTIPVDYVDGSIVTVSGRSVLSHREIEERNIRKYLIWFDTDKSVTLYNISRAIPYVEITKEIIVVEGFKSVWRLHQWGIRNVVATMGTSLSDEQRKILLKLGAKIIPCGDRDDAGKIFNKRVSEACRMFADVAAINLFDIDVPEKSSIDDITKEQFDYLYERKG